MVVSRWCCALVLTLFAAPLCGWTESSATSPSRKFREVTDNLETPVAIVPDPRNATNLLVAGRSGLIVSVDPRDGRTSAVVDIESLVGSSSPRGLVDIATETSGDARALFVGYLDPQGDLVVGRFSLARARSPLDEESMTVVIKIARLTMNTLGSSMALGPDGMLYIGTNDGEGTTTPRTHTAQLPQTLLGKVIRIKPGEKSGYSTPVDNPFHNQQNFQPEIWALGFRSPEALRFTGNSKQLLLLDSSERTNEINLVEPGKNYGWDATDVTTGCPLDSFAQPILVLPKDNPNSRLVGGFTYSGELYQELRDTLVFAETTSGTVYSAKERSPGTWERSTIGRVSTGAITALGQGQKGTIYVATERGELFEVH
jgi:glucose/arabinose dehydrogenase